MIKKLILVDFENVQKVDLSVLDGSYRAVIFVGAKQNPQKASRKPATAHRFERVDFQKIEGSGKNALDFHIAFHFGRTIETEPETECFVLSKDKGFDPLLAHRNKNGLRCKRLHSLEELAIKPVVAASEECCGHCRRASTIEHYGGQWCTYCGRFATPPDPSLLPSNQPAFAGNLLRLGERPADDEDMGIIAECGRCHRRGDMTGGIYDDGEWMCAGCIDRLAR